jgi:hypothetical protein
MNHTHTLVKSENAAYLRRTHSGDIHLCFRNLELSPDDTVPAAIYPPEVIPKPVSARYYVNTCMIIEYGRYESGWPELARRFVNDR